MFLHLEHMLLLSDYIDIYILHPHLLHLLINVVNDFHSGISYDKSAICAYSTDLLNVSKENEANASKILGNVEVIFFAVQNAK